ncbi:MAG: MarR family transcriptional regulator [Bacteriovoracaceae bacterium]|nr:MarR family transcriptional regulator [Bacteriovoracaceae bacterium]
MGRLDNEIKDYRGLESHLKNPEVESFASIMHISKYFDLLAARALQEFDISLSQFKLMAEIYFTSKRLSFSDLSRELHVSRPTISGLVSRLKCKGFIHLSESIDDSRVSYVLLSDEGEDTVRKTCIAFSTFTKGLFEGFDSDSVISSSVTLEKLLKRLTAIKSMELK